MQDDSSDKLLFSIKKTISNSALTTPASKSTRTTDHEGLFDEIIYNFHKIFQLDNKASLSDLQDGSAAFYFFVGVTSAFVFIIIISLYLDSSLRSQIFYVFDNCTSEDYMYEYIVKIRFGVLPGASNISDLIVELYNDKFKPLSKFSVNENYLENGLNISTKLCPGMKITSLYLFKKHSLHNLEYCRVYLNANDPNIFIHLYSIEVGNSREVQVFFFNYGINRSNQNATQVSLVVDEPITAKYNGAILETSYLQASLFIYSFFILNFFLCRLMPYKEDDSTVTLLLFTFSRRLLTNSILSALLIGLLYLVFRNSIHYKYVMSNGNLKWLLLERIFIFFVLCFNLYLAISCLLTKYNDSDEESDYVRFLISTCSTILFWVPFAFVFFHLFSPSNYHLGRIVMKNTYHVDKVLSSRRRKSLKSRIGHRNAEHLREENEEHKERPENTRPDKHYPPEKMQSVAKPSAVKSSLPIKKSQYQQQSQHQQQSQLPQQPQQTMYTQSMNPVVPQMIVPSSVNKFYPSNVPFSPALMPSYPNQITPKNFFANQYPFNIPAITYINDPQYANHFDAPVNLPVNQTYPINNYDLNANIVTPYRSLYGRGKRPPKAPVNAMPVFKKTKSLEKAPSNATQQHTKPLKPKCLKISESKASIQSTGSDYYAAMLKDGKLKVGSISQYGSALKQL